jgi:hypothetical protein
MKLSKLAFISVALLPAVFGAPTPEQHGDISKRSTEKQAMSTWCARFNAACVDACLSGVSSGAQKVTFACKANKDQVDFDFGCKCGNTDRTGQALNLIGGVSTSTTYTGTSTKVNTKTTVTTSKPTTTKTSHTIQTIANTITSTTSTTQTKRTTTTSSTATTTTRVRVLPTTYTSTHISTHFFVSQTTITQTSATLSGQPLATLLPYNIFEVSLARSSPSIKRRAANTDVFCRNFKDSCTRTCGKLSSKILHETCQRTSTTAYSYKLGCFCSNGKTETKHALANLEDSVDILSTLSVSTSSATVTLTKVAPIVTVQTVTGTSLETFFKTVTSSKAVTNTYVSGTTATYTSVTTVTPTRSTTTTTNIPLSTYTSTSTVLTILAPTGIVGVRKIKDDSLYGYLQQGDQGLLEYTATAANAPKYMLVADTSTSSGLYKLAKADLSGSSAVCELPTNANLDFETGSGNFCVMENYGSSATGASSANPNSQGSYENAPYETYWLKPYISTIANKVAVKIFPQWVNQDATNRMPTTYLLPDTNFQGVVATGDIAAAIKVDNTLANVPLYLSIGV